MAITMRAPSAVPAGTILMFKSGTSAVVPSTGLVSVPNEDVAELMEAGYVILAYGIATESQRASAVQAAIDTTAPTSTSPYGFSSTVAAAIIAMLNEVRATLVALGAWKGSA